MLRSMGRAVGAVVVEGGAEKVREPRLPMLPPPAGRAMASVAASASVAARATATKTGRKRSMFSSSASPFRAGIPYRDEGEPLEEGKSLAERARYFASVLAVGSRLCEREQAVRGEGLGRLGEP